MFRNTFVICKQTSPGMGIKRHTKYLYFIVLLNHYSFVVSRRVLDERNYIPESFNL